MLDDEPRGRIGRGGRTEIDVEPGEHTVFLRIDWCRSRVLRLKLEPGGDARLYCRPRGPLATLYGITFGRDNYMRLEAR